MPYSLGPNITRTGLVFAYDTGDQTNSYKGQPITNQFSVQGSSGFGSGANNNVTFPIQGTGTFVRLGFGQTFGGYTIQQNDVVYKYDLGLNGCHYHGMTAAIPAGAYATFTFDYYISPDTDFSTGNDTTLANFENYGGGALGGGVGLPNYAKGVWQTVTFTSGPAGAGTQAMFLYPGGCSGGRMAGNGYILYRNPQVVWLNYTVPFVQGTRSTTQGLLDISGQSTSIDLTNMTYTNGQLVFDGTNTKINPTTVWSYLSSSAMETVFRTTTVSPTYQTVFGYAQNFGYSQPTIGTIYLNGSNVNTSVITTTQVYRTAVASNAITANKFYHVVFNKDTIGGVMQIYVNGTLAATQTFDAATYAQWSTVGNYIGSNGLDIGKSSNNMQGWEASYFNGVIPICKIYNRTLSSAEILQNYNSYKTRFNIT
jgi:hypothetical protein